MRHFPVIQHTGIKIIQQISILMGCAVLPHLKNLVDIIEPGLEDEQTKVCVLSCSSVSLRPSCSFLLFFILLFFVVLQVRTITALALAALAEAAAPYGIESFDSVLKPLWRGTRVHRGKTLAAFLKAIGYIIPLMEPEYAAFPGFTLLLSCFFSIIT